MPEITLDYSVIALWGVIGYLLGSIPSGIIIARLMNLGNLRDVGSGNIGATNVLRTGNKKAAALTLLFDAGKGAIAILLARQLSSDQAVHIAGLMAFLGHCFPVWLRFKGGKGVATYFGIIWAAAWPAGVAASAIWLAIAAISRYSSLAALFAAGWTPIILVFVTDGNYFLLAAALGLLIYARHGANIARLRAGTETKIGAKS
ncbi:glycerol-3-phosphate 1-O-acyltransferase PlsY [Yoonia sp.]|uniref:glycerol-3-phosphate 1-O-acyltransferase PlsY n=1 Tax=Yoonia sp. TaxID=2212373 RepID=UPI0023B5C5A7